MDRKFAMKGAGQPIVYVRPVPAEDLPDDIRAQIAPDARFTPCTMPTASGWRWYAIAGWPSCWRGRTIWPRSACTDPAPIPRCIPLRNRERFPRRSRRADDEAAPCRATAREGSGLASGAPDTGDLISIPALLARNARAYGARPAYREKEFGIWQCWSWAEAEAEIRAMAAGFLVLGVERGDTVAVIGRNRPALYWAMVAAQMTGAIPVPLYQDAVAEEMAYVLDHCGARFVVAGDQEQVDKVLEIAGRLPALEHMMYLDPRGLRKYDHTKLHALDNIIAEGRLALDRLGRELAARIAEIDDDTTCVMLYTSGTRASPRAWCCRIATSSRPPVRRANSTILARTKRCWPICRWPGSAISSFRSGRPIGRGSA